MTLADQPTTVNPSVSRTRAKPDCIAAPPTIDAVASLGIDHIDIATTPERMRRPWARCHRRADDQICSGRAP